MESTANMCDKRSQMRFIGVTKDAVTAGPGKRLEFFLKGCIRGIVNPCEGCFNPTTWEFGGLRRDMSVEEVTDLIVRDAWNYQVTFCGGEPLLQTRNLIKVCKQLKALNPRFHIVVYTAYTYEQLMRNGITYRYRPGDGEDVREALEAYSPWKEYDGKKIVVKSHEIEELMKYIDLLVDGDYQADKRLPTEKYMNAGMFVGSSNQRVIDAPRTVKEGMLRFDYADIWALQREAEPKHCKCCGHAIPKERSYCDGVCQKNYHKRNKEMAVFGGA